MRIKRKKLIIIILLLIISIGYAVLSSNLLIGGKINYSASSWNVYFDNINTYSWNAVVNQEPTISSDKLSINYDVTLNNPNDRYIFYSDIVNDGTIDVMYNSLDIEGLSEEIKKFIDVKVTYADGNDLQEKNLLKSQTKDKIKVETRFITDISKEELPVTAASYNITLTFNYILADKDAVSRQRNNAVTYLQNNTNDELVVDRTTDKNLRFVGKNPNNYISFNNQLWRIIGVFNNTYDSTNQKASRIKITPAEIIGKYSWDSTDTSINGGYGVNEWSASKISKLLNDSYYNSKNDICYIGGRLETEECDFRTLGIKEETKDYIEEMIWDTSLAYWDNSERPTALGFYEEERSGNVTPGCNATDGSPYCTDTIERKAKWIGNIGLPSVSDFAFAAGTDDNITRNECWNLRVAIYDYHENYTYSNNCLNNNWLIKPSDSEDGNMYWTMTPITTIDEYSRRTIFHFASAITGIHSSNTGYKHQIYPTLFLKEDVIIKSGVGTIDDPYIIE